MANAKNLSAGKLYQSISSSTTNILVYVGDGGASTIKAVWPTVPFYATIMPANPVAGVANSMDSEIVLVNAVGNDQVGNTALTVKRGQRGTTAKAFNAGAVVLNGIYTEDLAWSSILNKIYPIGSIFMSATLSTATEVNNTLGGTWVAWGAGRVPVGVDTSQTEFDTVSKTGGEKTHKLTINEMPKHQHKLSLTNYGSDSASGVNWGNNGVKKYAYSQDMIEPVGGDTAHNNLQPYITCYMYKRTA